MSWCLLVLFSFSIRIRIDSKEKFSKVMPMLREIFSTTAIFIWILHGTYQATISFYLGIILWCFKSYLSSLSGYSETETSISPPPFFLLFLEVKASLVTKGGWRIVCLRRAQLMNPDKNSFHHDNLQNVFGSEHFTFRVEIILNQHYQACHVLWFTLFF